MDKLEHGGDPIEMERLYGRPEEGWLDLSTGINPLPYPAKSPELESWGPLPTADNLIRLRDAAAERYGVADATGIVPAPGTQALIQWLPRMRGTSSVAVLSPTYNEHAHCWRTAGHTVDEINDLAETRGNYDVVIVVNPNNPDGHRHDPVTLKTLVKDQAERGGWLIVDEAFCDVTPDLTLAGDAGSPGLIVLRSFGKFYGLAGLRLGFALVDPVMAERLTTFLGPWAVSTPAISIGIQALQDDDWTERTRRLLQDASGRLDHLLIQAGMDLVGGTSLYRLVSTGNAEAIYHAMAGNGILVRRFEQKPEWLRFGLPGHEKGWRRLESGLANLSFSEAAG